MSPLFMDAVYQLNSPSSVSAEESNTTGSERGEAQVMTSKGIRRQEKNRDAARKSRKKQTERADELHEELQCLERTNSALIKEIAALKKDLQLYTRALERHKPFCCVKDAASSCSPTNQLSVSPSANCQTNSSPPGVPPQASGSTFAASPSLSTSLTSSLGLGTHDCVDSTQLSSSAPPGMTTLASPSGSSTELFSSSSSVVVPDSVSFSMAPTHSLFSKDPPPLITSRPTNVPLVCTSVVSSPVPSSCLTAAAAQPHSGHGSVHESSSISANNCFSPLHSGTLDEFLMKQASFLTASSNEVPPYSHLAEENAGLVATGCAMNVPRLHPGLSPPCSLQDPALQSLSPPSSAFAVKPSYSRQDPLNSVSLLSLLTVPSPPNASPTTSSSFDGLLSQPPPLLPLLGHTAGDLSLSEFLEVNDWILSETSNQ